MNASALIRGGLAWAVVLAVAVVITTLVTLAALTGAALECQHRWRSRGR